MSPSYRGIHYGLRPAKNIERKMLCEAFSRLSAFGKIETYRYVGFGSTYFSDFILFHKNLNICNMISLEKDIINKDRFKFNLPFSCIEVKFGESNEELPKLAWDCRTIIWLDYDGTLEGNVLTDIKFICANAISGSFIVVTINAVPESGPDRLDKLKNAVGNDKVSPSLTSKDLTGWGYANICKKIINNAIGDTLNARNGGRMRGTKFNYKQLINFHYSDNAKMMTTGGIIFDEGQETLLSQCAFHNLSFIRECDDPYKIEVPNLTYKEIRRLNEQLPRTASCPSLPAVPQSDIDKFEKIYRYFPNFAESNI